MAVAALLAGPDGFAVFNGAELVAPPLLWPEVRSALHQIRWRGHLSKDEVTTAHSRLYTCPVLVRQPARLGQRAWGHCRSIRVGQDVRRGVPRAGRTPALPARDPRAAAAGSSRRFGSRDRANGAVLSGQLLTPVPTRCALLRSRWQPALLYVDKHGNVPAGTSPVPTGSHATRPCGDVPRGILPTAVEPGTLAGWHRTRPSPSD